jgi:hypothetical protein
MKRGIRPTLVIHWRFDYSLHSTSSNSDKFRSRPQETYQITVSKVQNSNCLLFQGPSPSFFSKFLDPPLSNTCTLKLNYQMQRHLVLLYFHVKYFNLICRETFEKHPSQDKMSCPPGWWHKTTGSITWRRVIEKISHAHRLCAYGS